MILNDSLFRTIYNAFFNIKEAAKDLAKGEKTFFFSGGRDEEIIDLTQNLNIAAKKIYEAKETLEESKSILEIKVKSRTEELQELAENLDKEVKERTEELQRKVKELEKFQRFATGREIKMVELKKEIEELKEKLKKVNIKG
jgi:methyl-accepting chemotaxis protein